MPSRTPVTAPLLQQALRALPGWRVQDGRLQRDYEFSNFTDAMGWMLTVAVECERLDHHPDWTNIYNKVSVRLWTHDVRAITELDLDLARAMEQTAARLAEKNS